MDKKQKKCRHKFLMCEKPVEFVTWDGPFKKTTICVIKYHKCINCGKNVGG